MNYVVTLQTVQVVTDEGLDEYARAVPFVFTAKEYRDCARDRGTLLYETDDAQTTITVRREGET